MSSGREWLGRDNGIEHGEPPGGDLNNLHSAETSFLKVAASVPRWILKTRTKFSDLLARSFSLQCRGAASASIVFPLPLADFNLFSGGGPKRSLRKWSCLAKKRLLHVVIVALNYLEGCLDHHTIPQLGRRPNDIQKSVHARLRSLVAMCDSPSLGTIPVLPGRSGPEFIARLTELEQFAKSHHFFSQDHYASGPSDFEKSAPIGTAVVDPANLEVQPYTSLDASRLRLTGEGKWDLQEFLDDDVLWLPYVEPKILQHNLPVDWSLGPVLSREDPDECLRLALIWDQKGLLSLVRDKPHRDAFTRVFNCYKNPECDRQIGDRRFANKTECGLQGPSKFLPGGYMLTNLHIPRGCTAHGSISDRKDFYHQCAVSRARASTNVLPFSYSLSSFKETLAFKELEAIESTRGSGREKIGDKLGYKRPSVLVAPGDFVYPAFNSLLQGDHLGVEFATAGHECMLSRAGLLQPRHRLRGHHPLPLSNLWEGLVIDDYFAVSVAPASLSSEKSRSVRAVNRATDVYAKHEVLGSPEKDILGSRHFKVVGAEIDSSRRALSLNKATVAAPLQKRIAMVLLTLRVAQMPYISSSLASRLAGNWTSIFMFRRCLSCVLSEIFTFGHGAHGEESDVFVLPRTTAEELVLASILCFVAASDVTVDYAERIFATDASMSSGAVVSRDLSLGPSKVLWLGGDKKGSYTSLDPPFRELVRALGEQDEDEPIPGPPADSAPMWRAPDFVFDFIEVCAGVASVSKKLAGLGFSVATPIELSDSKHFDVIDLKLVGWLCNMLKSGRLRSMMVETVCTTFSAAAHPALRSYACPLGFRRDCPKTLRGNEIAFRCLFLAWFASLCDCPVLCEQPRLSKMAWLSIWLFLIREKGFAEAIVASCQFGSIHRKEFRLLGWGIDMQALETRCPGGHDHVRIEGKWTKDSAVYVPALAEHLARAFAKALRRKIHTEAATVDVKGLESVVCNDVLSTGAWRTELVWHWRSPAHINVLESSAFVTLLRLLCKQGGDLRFTVLLDSQVAKCSHAKGRSSARALRPTLKKAAALQICGGLYPAFNFAPTRLNTADGPSRQRDIGQMSSYSLVELLEVAALQKLHSVCISRAAAGWVRLALLLMVLQPVTADDGHPCIRTFAGSCSSFLPWIFSLTLSLLLSSVLQWTFQCGIFLMLIRASTSFSHGVLGRLCLGWFACAILFDHHCNPNYGCHSKVHEMQPLPPAFPCFSAYAMPIQPVSTAETDRAQRRATVTLFADRVVRPLTRDRREQLLQQFNSWLLQKAQISLEVLLTSHDTQAEDVAGYLVEYGKELFYGGKPYGRYAETINGVASKKPVLKRQLVAAWDLAFSWVADEPARHHPAMPLSVLLAFASLALLWGWAGESAIFLLTWTGAVANWRGAHCKTQGLNPSTGWGSWFAVCTPPNPTTQNKGGFS